MPQEPEKSHIQIKLSEVPRHNTLEVQSVYTNSANVFFTQWDCRFIFNEMIVDSDGKATMELRANVAMAPLHAKAFLSVLTTSLELFEKENGELVWPPKESAKGK
jgi:Protein of unknown function (DUF3467)